MRRAWARYLGSGFHQAAPTVLTGAIDEPGVNTVIRGTAITCSGWALRNGGAASSVEIHVDGLVAGRARVGIPRADLAALGADGGVAGWETTLALPAVSARRTVEIIAVAYFEAGRRPVPLGSRTVTVVPWPRVPRAVIEEILAPDPGFPRPHEGPHVLAVTPQLDLGGGQLYLEDLVLGLHRAGAWRVSVASVTDGPLRRNLEEAGIDVHLMPPWPLHDPRLYANRLEELSAWARERGVTAVVANTAGAFPGVHLAARMGVPSIWAIHESFPMASLWHAYFGYEGCHPAIRAAADEALRIADRMVFEARATADLYSPLVDPKRCAVVPYGVDLAAMDAAMASAGPSRLRDRLRIPRNARLLLSVGVFTTRKSQLMLVRAFREVAEAFPDSMLVLVGADDTAYTASVRGLAVASGLAGRIRVERVTSELLPWYRAADVLISASDIESMPRSMIEAMACRTPVLAARVYGVPELVDDDSGWLFEPRDLTALIQGMERVLSAPPAELRRRGEHASARVRRDHDAAGYVDAYLGFLAELTAGPHGVRDAAER
jgi:glycosyltransferase involved in cell wall biosynthesis